VGGLGRGEWEGRGGGSGRSRRRGGSGRRGEWEWEEGGRGRKRGGGRKRREGGWEGGHYSLSAVCKDLDPPEITPLNKDILTHSPAMEEYSLPLWFDQFRDG